MTNIYSIYLIHNINFVRNEKLQSECKYVHIDVDASNHHTSEFLISYLLQMLNPLNEFRYRITPVEKNRLKMESIC